MIEEPYRWVEAIQNRREYIETQLSAGSPIVALSCAAGILLVTVSHGQRKLFEIYDRIAMGGIGHPGDIERLRMSAIEMASTEGFSRSVDDVSLRRLAAYSLSPTLKNAFEQIYGPPFLTRLLFAELSRNGGPDLLLRLDYDGAFQTNESWMAPEGSENGEGGEKVAFNPETSRVKHGEPFAVLAGKPHATKSMEHRLRKESAIRSLSETGALELALQAWAAGHRALVQGTQRSENEGSGEDGHENFADEPALSAHLKAQLAEGAVEAVLLERHTKGNVAFRRVKGG